MEIEIKSIAALLQFAEKYLSELVPEDGGATVLGLSGDLGSGKTAFTKALAKVLGIEQEVLSPTFVLAKYYPIKKHPPFSKLIHIDLYRIDNPEEVSALRFDEMLLDRHNLVIVEWPEQAGKFFPPSAPVLSFRFIDELSRGITAR